MHKKFLDKVRILTIGLAMSLTFTQTVQATSFITPFGATQVYQVETQPSETESAAPEVSTEELGPGVNPETETTSQQPSGVVDNQAAQQGPGAAETAAVNVIVPSASYSTTEPIRISVKTEEQSGPGVENTQKVQTEVRVLSASELEEAAKKAEIAIPEIAAQGAILYDVTHDNFIFEKNADKQFPPASITKVLTALLVLEHAKLTDTVTYSKTAVTNLESGAVTLQLQEGDKVSVKDSLYGLMLKSANEVANGLAEHVGGSLKGFSTMMNAKAKELGCTNSNFVNPNGLNNSEHYTTARDMARITAEAFKNETFREITSTASYKFPATKAAKARMISMGHKMIYKSNASYYSGILGGKTGYTSKAGNTLVTCVERDGVRMVAVILKSNGTHYTDTKALFDYGFALAKAGVLTEEAAVTPSAVDHSAGPGAVQTEAAVPSAGPGAVQNAEQTITAFHKWIADGTVWRFELADGTRLSNCFVTIDGMNYAFDTEGKMVTGWLSLGSNWHYFDSTGAMVKNEWKQDGNLWFYLGEQGAMARNAWIDDQYYVGADGVWVQ